MQIQFLGVSSALTVGYGNFQTNMLLNSRSGKRLLIDCGCDVRHALHELGYTHSDLDAVYISHLHSDHVGGLEWLGFSKLFIEKTRIPLYISPDQREILWNNVLSGGMSTLEEQNSSLDTFFEVMPFSSLEFKWENINFTLVKVVHNYSNCELLPSYGLFINNGSHKVFISTDTRFTPELLAPFYEQADLIFQDCEISTFHSNQHAHYNQLKTLNPNIKKKMWLYDYNDTTLPNAELDGFQGFVNRGQVFAF
jgi:ribonuclease BN (tRNA processing enzyme)